LNIAFVVFSIETHVLSLENEFANEKYINLKGEKLKCQLIFFNEIFIARKQKKNISF